MARQRGRQIEIETSEGPISVWVWRGREIGAGSGTREHGWWFAAEDCDASGPYDTYEEAEAEAIEAHDW